MDDRYLLICQGTLSCLVLLENTIRYSYPWASSHSEAEWAQTLKAEVLLVECLCPFLGVFPSASLNLFVLTNGQQDLNKYMVLKLHHCTATWNAMASRICTAHAMVSWWEFFRLCWPRTTKHLWGNFVQERLVKKEMYSPVYPARDSPSADTVEAPHSSQAIMGVMFTVVYKALLDSSCPDPLFYMCAITNEQSWNGSFKLVICLLHTWPRCKWTCICAAEFNSTRVILTLFGPPGWVPGRDCPYWYPWWPPDLRMSQRF